MNWAEATKDIPINPAFQSGINPAFQSGANAQDSAKPANDGENAQELAEPAKATDTEDSAQNPDNSADADDSAEDGENPEQNGDNVEAGKEMSKEERAANAARRREEKTQALVEKARLEERQKLTAEKDRILDESIATLKLVNPYTNKPIQSRADYDAFVKARDDARISESMDKLGIDREILDSVINQHPAIVEAQKIAAEADKEKQRILDDEAVKRLDTELVAIQKYDKTVKTAEDLLALPNYADIRRFVQAGLSISEAFEHVNRDKIDEQKRKATWQEAINSVNSKSHMKAGDASQGTGGIVVPPDVEKQYMNNFPGITREEIQKKYAQVQTFIKKG